jgi:hypothetical protein
VSLDLTQVRAIARPDFLDGLRSRRLLVTRALTPVVLFVVVLAVSLLSGGVEAETGDGPLVVAVEGDLAGARETLSFVEGSRIELVPSDDAALDAADEADAGMRVPDALDAKVAADEAASVELLEVTPSPSSRSAVAQLRASIADLGRDDLVAAAGTGTGLLDLTVTDLELTRGGTRVLAAELVASVLVLQAALLVGSTANRFVARRGRGLVQGRLLLPVGRSTLALGTAAGELGVGMVASSLVLVPATALAAGVLGAQFGPLAGVAGAAVIAGSALVLSGTFAALGLVVGVRSRTPEQVTLSTGISVVGATVVAALVGLGVQQLPEIVALVPLAGVVSETRATLSGDGRPLALVAAWVVTLLLAGVLVLRGGRALEAERLVRRGA